MVSNNVVKVEACMAAMKSDKVKEALREVTTLLLTNFPPHLEWQVTEEAVDRGAFGAPTMYFTQEGREEMFWGSDRWPSVTFNIHYRHLNLDVKTILNSRFDMIAHCFNKHWHGPDPGK